MSHECLFFKEKYILTETDPVLDISPEVTSFTSQVRSWYTKVSVCLECGKRDRIV